ncbi:MAG: 50S ribosomal protein L3 [Chloroflexi bacterium ADurb.Bin222]|nr:MAG: 50S ribosomal protein L3 [Chloroflexi bacterium ADurb.Bin222]
MKGILGKKVGMTQVIKDDGEVVAVTVLSVGPCYVTQVRTPEKDGYRAVQLGYEPDKAKHLSKGERGHLEHSGVPLLRHLRELRIREDEQYEVGQVIKADVFAPGERVDVIGTSKGRGSTRTVSRIVSGASVRSAPARLPVISGRMRTCPGIWAPSVSRPRISKWCWWTLSVTSWLSTVVSPVRTAA